MPTKILLFALAAGAISAVVFASATTGPVLVRTALFILTPLSLYLAGLGLGAVAGAIAAITATSLVLLISNPTMAGLFGLTSALPAYLTTRRALLSRGEGEVREWYPIGRIVVTAAAFGTLFAVLALIVLGGDLTLITKTMREVVANFVKTELAQLPNAPTITEAQIDEMAQLSAQMLPWALGVLATSIILGNLWLAGRITHASGLLSRPWPDLSALALPAGATFALLGALLLGFLGGNATLFSGAAGGPFMLAFAIVGLAVAHALTRGSPWRSFLLAGLYATAVVFPAGALVLLAIAGLAETVFGYRRVSERGPPDS